MKILHTSELYSPILGGAQEAVRQISERLVERGHEVTVATKSSKFRREKSINGVIVKEFDISGNSISGYHGNIDAYRDLLLSSDFDIVMNYAAQQWATDIALPLLDNIKSKKVFVPCGFSGFFLPQFEKYYKGLLGSLRKYDATIYFSKYYRDFIIANNQGLNNLIVIPNGADEREFSRKPSINIRHLLNIPENDFLIIHVGSHTGLKGHREAIKIFNKSRIKNSTLLIIGNDLRGCTYECHLHEQINKINFVSRINNKKLIIRPMSRLETISAYFEADIFLFPSNIECSPIVLFECMASKTPFLTTDVGNSKEIINESMGGMLLPTKIDSSGYSKARINESAKLLEYMFSNENLRIKMGYTGYEHWRKKFTWDQISKNYEEVYKKLVNK